MGSFIFSVSGSESTLENDKFIGISETDFIEKVAQDQEFCYNSELHIKTVCYFMQQNGYSNDVKGEEKNLALNWLSIIQTDPTSPTITTTTQNNFPRRLELSDQKNVP